MIKKQTIKFIDKTNHTLEVKECEKNIIDFKFHDEMKKIILNEDQFNNILEMMLNEKLHISDDVIDSFKIIKNSILRNIAETSTINNSISIPHKENELKFELFGSDLTVKYDCYFLNSKQDIASIMQKLDITSYVNNDEKTIYLNFFNIDNQYFDPRYFDDALQHELEHFYQFIKKGGTALIPKSDLYKQALKYLNDNGNDGFNRVLATIIYLSYKQEWDGFINGSYAMLCACDIRTMNDFNEYFVQTEVYRSLQNLIYLKEVLKENEDNENLHNAMKEISNKTLKWYNRVVDYSIKNLTKKVNGLKKLYLTNKGLIK